MSGFFKKCVFQLRFCNDYFIYRNPGKSVCINKKDGVYPRAITPLLPFSEVFLVCYQEAKLAVNGCASFMFSVGRKQRVLVRQKVREWVGSVLSVEHSIPLFLSCSKIIPHHSFSDSDV